MQLLPWGSGWECPRARRHRELEATIGTCFPYAFLPEFVFEPLGGLLTEKLLLLIYILV